MYMCSIQVQLQQSVRSALSYLVTTHLSFDEDATIIQLRKQFAKGFINKLNTEERKVPNNYFIL